MTDARFEKFWPRLMKYEGGATVVNNPKDPGGLTKYGISKRSYPGLDIANLTEQQAKDITYDDYYTPLSIGAFVDDRIAWQVFDFGYNAGVVKSAKTIQKIVGAKEDGNIGPKSINLINLFEGEFPLFILFMSERLKYYMKIVDRKQSQIIFLKGWILRTVEL